MINCSNCSAKFSEDLSACPYCGQIYIPGAEKAYLENLQEIREDMSDIEGISGEIYQSEIKKNVKKTGVIIASLVIFLFLGIGAVVGMNHLFSYTESEEEIKERMLWQRENFPVLDDWYEGGNYQVILDFMEKTYEEKGYSFYEWEHYDFIRQYENYQICMDIRARIEEGGDISDFDAGELLYCGMSLRNYANENSGYSTERYSESAVEQLELWKQEVETIFVEKLQYSEEALQELQSKLYEEGFLSYDACCDYREEILERIQQK